MILDNSERYIHPSADIQDISSIGYGTIIWQRVRISNCSIGNFCRIGSDSTIDSGAKIGNKVKIQNQVLIFGAQIEDMVFIGPKVMILEDPNPRSVTELGDLKSFNDWDKHPVRIKEGASIGAGTILAPGIEIGSWSKTAVGSVCVSSIPSHVLVAGNPARSVGYVCLCGRKLDVNLSCSDGRRYQKHENGDLSQIDNFNIQK